MTYQVFCQSFAPGSWKWTSKDPAGIGMRLDAAFRSFAAIVNASTAIFGVIVALMMLALMHFPWGMQW